MEYTATMTSKGQITIPAALREALGLKAGDRVQFFAHPITGAVSIVPKNRPMADLEGFFAHLPPAEPDADDAIGAALAEDDDRILNAASRKEEDAA